MEHVILVDEKDREIGTEEKLKAHQDGLLHRAFSILVFNSKNELLLQKRALNKYHCGGLWTNTCCSHPRPGEKLMDAANRRLNEEMGFSCPLEWKSSITYKAEFDNGLTEHEVDHIILGHADPRPTPNADEVHEWRWISLENLKQEIDTKPHTFTPWFKLIFDKIDQLRN